MTLGCYIEQMTDKFELTKLKGKIYASIEDPDNDLEELLELLSPVTLNENDDVFKENLIKIFSTVTSHMANKNEMVTFDFVKLMSKDLPTIISVVTAVSLLIKTLPSLKINKKEFIFKILVFMCLVFIPNQLGHDLSKEEQTKIADYLIKIYGIIIRMKLISAITAKVEKWFKAHPCICAKKSTNQELFDEHLPKVLLSTYKLV